MSNAAKVGFFLSGVFVGVGVMGFIAKLFEDQLRSRIQIAGCSFKGQSENTKSRIYECPDGLLYVVDGDIRNAKGE